MEGGSSASLSSKSAAPARKRKPGTWGRLPRVPRAATHAIKERGELGIWFITPEELQRQALERANELEKMDDSGCDTEEAKIAFRAFKEENLRLDRWIAKGWPEHIVVNRNPQPSDMEEEYLTAEDMEARFSHRNPTHGAQLKHFACLALAHYNATKTEHKFDLGEALTSNWFSEACGTTYAHVNFTAIPQKSNHPTKRLFFVELMLIPELQMEEDTEPMRVLHVSTIDDVPCYGGCHEICRKITHRMRGVMDYERCHACHGSLKHPKGDMFIGGHNSTRMPYYSAT
ncbi:unnamed protein product [Triticum turgidum subsp. durum]|uniref:DUF3615 domain-containing protein n=1 Tax=Triticum turgidum subsp. durum TaxID=4567 RepID=A0A9R1BUN2_TRITD|nr:unnamed protein product [Triticum turgidum subsp. durum]